MGVSGEEKCSGDLNREDAALGCVIRETRVHDADLSGF